MGQAKGPGHRHHFVALVYVLYHCRISEPLVFPEHSPIKSNLESSTIHNGIFPILNIKLKRLYQQKIPVDTYSCTIMDNQHVKVSFGIDLDMFNNLEEGSYFIRRIWQESIVLYVCAKKTKVSSVKGRHFINI